MFVPCSGHSPSFQGCRLILPCISVGNVGQLTVDLIINSLKLDRVGYLQDPALLPLVGNDAFDHTTHAGQGHLHTAAEVYGDTNQKIAVVQIRAPVAKGFQQSFCTNLLKWGKESGFSEVVLLTSSHAHERRDAQIRGRPYRFLLNSHSSDLFRHFTETLNWTSLEPRGQGEDEPGQRTDAALDESQLFIPGAGLTKKLYVESAAAGVRLVVLIAFCSQGDNIPDATGLASYLDEWLLLKSQLGKVLKAENAAVGWQCPDSWGLMYGGPSPDSLF